jgi:hypothetical protein
VSRRTTRVAVTLLVLFTACGTNGLSFVTDERVKIVAPVDRSQVQLPVTVRWTVRDFSLTGPAPSTSPNAGYFGVFVDRAPQPPGETFADLAKNDATCKVTPGCPNTGYFESLGAYTTMSTSFTIRDLPEIRREEERDLRDFHEVNVVLLNGRGERIGESAFTVQFELKRDTV